MELNDVTQKIIGCAIEVHRHLGPGLLESAYQECLIFELELANMNVRSEIEMPITYKGLELDKGYTMDLLVEESVVVELKSVEALRDEHKAQTLTYLRLGDFKVGLLINFNVSKLTDGLVRIVNNF